MNKLKTTGFWIGLGGAVVLVVQTIGELFGFSINSQVVNTLISSICGVLVVVGILIPTKTDSLKLNLPGVLDDSSNQQTEQNNNQSEDSKLGDLNEETINLNENTNNTTTNNN